MHQLGEIILPEGVGAGFARHARFPVLEELTAPASGSALVTGRCGDAIAAAVVVEEGSLSQIRLEPRGCVYTVVCASAMTELARGRTLEQAVLIEPEQVVELLGGLPEDHHHCARLAVNALIEAVVDHYQRQDSKGGNNGGAHAHS